jgi:hypothetical protein
MPLVNESINGMRTDIRNSTGDVLRIKYLCVTLTESYLKNTDELAKQFSDLRDDLGQGLQAIGTNLTRRGGGTVIAYN